MTTPLEDIPNELFLYIFRRLSIIDIYNSFSNLNDRFSALIAHFMNGKKLVIDGHLTRFQIAFIIKNILPSIDDSQVQILEIRHDDLFRDFLNLNSFSPSFVTTLSLVSLNDITFDPVYCLLIRCHLVQAVIIDVRCDGNDAKWLDGLFWDEIVDSFCLHLKSLRVAVCQIFKNRSISTMDIISSFKSPVWNQRQWNIKCLDQRGGTRELRISANKK